MANKYNVRSVKEASVAINRNRGACCRIRLRVKWNDEKDWLDHIIWMVPGWEPTDIWKEAYAFIDEQNMTYLNLIGEPAIVEEARLDEFKLV